MDLAAAFHEVVRISAECRHPTDGWLALVAYLESAAGTALPNLRSVDVAGDVRGVREQLEQLLQSEPMPRNLNAVWFGLFDAIEDDHKRTIGFYVAGVEAFDVNNGDSLCDPAWWPEGRYLSSTSLDAIKSAELAAASSKNPNVAAVLGYGGQLGAALIVVKFASAHLFGGLKRVVGFDSGDFSELPA